MLETKRVAVVTGAPHGIGKRTAEVLSTRGYSLVLSDLRSPSETLRILQTSGGEAIEFVGDISDEAVVARLTATVRERRGRADVLVNNAGISMIAPAEDLSAADYRRVLEI